MRKIAAVAITFACLALSLAEEQKLPPQAAISNGQIRATLYLPDPEKGYYRGTRFDWSGVIATLQYKGHNYYGPWFQKSDPKVRDVDFDGPDVVVGPNNVISGPAEEFMLDTKSSGYEDAAAGGTFVKIGVGILRKPDESTYDRLKVYQVVDPGKWTVRTSRSRIEFLQEVRDTSGFAYAYRKVVRLSEGKPQMVLEHSLRNTGSRPIVTSVYNHNFLVLDEQPPGPDFAVTFPFPITTSAPLNTDLAAIDGRRFLFVKRLENQERVSTGIRGFGDGSKDYDIRIGNTRIGAGVRITGDRPLSRVHLWSIRTVLAVEPFVALAIEPGKEFSWTLAYDFYTFAADR